MAHTKDEIRIKEHLEKAFATRGERSIDKGVKKKIEAYTSECMQDSNVSSAHLSIRLR